MVMIFAELYEPHCTRLTDWSQAARVSYGVMLQLQGKGFGKGFGVMVGEDRRMGQRELKSGGRGILKDAGHHIIRWAARRGLDLLDLHRKYVLRLLHRLALQIRERVAAKTLAGP